MSLHETMFGTPSSKSSYMACVIMIHAQSTILSMIVPVNRCSSLRRVSCRQYLQQLRNIPVTRHTKRPAQHAAL